MKTLYVFIAVLFAASACNKSAKDSCTPEKKEYSFQSGKQIDHQKRIVADTTYEYYMYSVKNGDKQVFNFTWQYKDCPEVADDEGARVIIFEVPQNVNSFQFKDSAGLREAKVMVNYACFCYPSGPILVKGGSITGEKKGVDRWHVKGSLVLLPALTHTIDFEADFLQK